MGNKLISDGLRWPLRIFKNISKHLDETRHHFEPVPPDTNMQRALERLVRKSAIFSQPTQGDIEQSHESEKAF